jgi:hypothetical protein
MITPTKRQKMEKLIYDTFNALDSTHQNTNRYKQMFSEMSDSQFDSFFKSFFKNENEYLILNVSDYQINLTIEDIEKGAKVLGVPLFERLALPHYTMDKDNVIVSKEAVPVGYCHIKRTQQTLAKKNGLSTTSDTRSAMTGQVTGGDKNGRESDLENSILVSLGMTETLKELNGPRADDVVMKHQMYTAINNKGYVTFEDMESDTSNKTTLNTINTYLLGMGLNSDLVTRGLMTNKTLKEEV